MLLTKEQATEFAHRIAAATTVNVSDPEKALSMYLSLWDELPEPKNKNPEQVSNWLISCIFNVYFYDRDFVKAKEWAIKGLENDTAQDGSFEYVQLGRTCYELEEYEEAQKYFDIAWQRGKKRAFQPYDKKYWQFYSDNKKKK